MTQDIRQQITQWIGSQYIDGTTRRLLQTAMEEIERLQERNEGPGTPAARFHYLYDELSALFPGVINPFLSDPPEPKLLNAVRALQKDAERYRWIREQNASIRSTWCIEDGYLWVGEDLDAAVDAAMAKDKP